MPESPAGRGAPLEQMISELNQLAAWLENPHEAIADRTNVYRTAATIRGILAAYEAIHQCPKCGKLSGAADAYCDDCAREVLANVELAAASRAPGVTTAQETPSFLFPSLGWTLRCDSPDGGKGVIVLTEAEAVALTKHLDGLRSRAPGVNPRKYGA